MDHSFHFSYPENFRSHPNLCHLDKYISESLDSAARQPEGEYDLQGGDIVYVMSGIGRIRLGRHVYEARPGTVVGVLGPVNFEFWPSPGSSMDVRRIS